MRDMQQRLTEHIKDINPSEMAILLPVNRLFCIHERIVWCPFRCYMLLTLQDLHILDPSLLLKRSLPLPQHLRSGATDRSHSWSWCIDIKSATELSGFLIKRF